jgi:protein TonB
MPPPAKSNSTPTKKSATPPLAPTTKPAPQPTSAAPAPAPKPVPDATPNPPAANSKSPAVTTPVPSAAKSTPAPAAASIPATASSPSNSSDVHGKVLQQVLPNVGVSARATIRGTVRVTIRIHADASGQVTDASIDSRGPSQFFADRSLQAAKLWKFAPARQNGQPVPTDWLIHFEIDPTTINVHATQTNP